MVAKTTWTEVYERWGKRPFPFWFPWLIFLSLSVLAALFWRAPLADDAYLSLRFAQTIGSGADKFGAQLLASGFAGYLPLSPTSWLVLAVAARLGWDLQIVTLVLGALGWGITAVFWHKLLRDWRLPLVAWVIPLLLIVSPVAALAAGSFVSWFVALAWLAIWLTVNEKWRAQTIVLFLLLVVNVSLTAVALIVILVMWRIVINQRHPLTSSEQVPRKLRIEWTWLVLGLLTGWCLVTLTGIGYQINQAPWQVNFPFADWLGWGREWLSAGEFVGLLLLFALIAPIGKRQTRPIALWLLFALLDVNVVGQTVLASGLLFLAGVGIGLTAQWLAQKQWLDLPEETVYRGAVLLLCLPLVWTIFSYPLNRQESVTEVMQAGAWLRENSPANALVLAQPAVGYAADRAVMGWNGRSDQQNWADFIRKFEAITPGYIVTDAGLFWDGLIHHDWWQDRYTLAQTFGTHHIWQTAPQPALTTQTVPLNVVLENGVKLVGYQQSPQTIIPGESVNISLHFQVDESFGNGFNTVIWLPSPLDGANQALQDLLTPRAVPSNWWLPGQIVTEQFVLTTTEQIPAGGYRMTVAFRTQDNFDKMPVYQNGDSNPLDRIQLGYVAVPWTGVVDEAAVPFKTRFADQFQLLAANLPAAQANPGDELDIEFFWEGLAPNRPQHDYTIFVHLINEKGEMAANVDSPPQGGQYATGAWVVGSVVPDPRRLPLPPDLPPGTYHLHVGAYLPQTGERLPVFDEAGNEIPGASLPLMKLVVE